MRLLVSKSANASSFYVQKDIKKGNSRTTVIVEKLGTETEIMEKYGVADAKAWALDYIASLNRIEKEKKTEIMPVNMKLFPQQTISNRQRIFNGGYLPLQSIYHSLGLNKICKKISSNGKFEYNLNSILSRLIYTRILFPGSKLNAFEESKKFIEDPEFDLHQVYRALDVLNKESDYIQSQLYKNSTKVTQRNASVLYYDCTNYFFEIEEADDEGQLRQYGRSKENRPNPLVQMGLFMDGNGIPLTFDITSGNTNEQTTLRPLEKKIIEDFNLSKFIVCTDAGLSSNANKKYNSIKDRAYITTQSLKKIKKHLKEWSLDPNGWKKYDSTTSYNINEIDEEENRDTIFYKERWINENGLEEKLIVTYSIKYRDYHRNIRSNQIHRANELIKKGSLAAKKIRDNDIRRFIRETKVTSDGEIADRSIVSLDENKIMEESLYDGFYAVVTNLEAEAHEIAQINKNRWQIEECFRIMKSEFKARPIYLSNDERIKAHFLICFLALTVYRILEVKLGNKYTVSEITKTLREMNMLKTKQNDYIPAFNRTQISDDIFEVFEYRLDYEIITEKNMKKILKATTK